jgi:hypothetical protein
MARKLNKSHPDLHRYIARYEFNPVDDDFEVDYVPTLFDTPDEALESITSETSEGEVYYIYQLVEVRQAKKPTLFPNYVPETE